MRIYTGGTLLDMDNSVTEMASQKLVEGLIEDIAIGKELMSFPEESGNETRKEQGTCTYIIIL